MIAAAEERKNGTAVRGSTRSRGCHVNRLVGNLGAFVAVGGLAVAAATPAIANDVRWYVENDNDYTLSMKTSGVPFVPKGGIGDRCRTAYWSQVSGFLPNWSPVTVTSDEHKYLCYHYISLASGISKYGQFVLGDVVASTPAGNSYPLVSGDDVVGSLVKNPPIGQMDLLPLTSADAEDHPGWNRIEVDWLDQRMAKADVGGYDLTYRVTWRAPVEAETKLQNLMSVEPTNCTITGTDGDDVIEGTDGDDVICAGDGDDVIDGKGGDDVIIAGPGDDTVDAGDGDDVVKGGSGDDEIAGGDGDDTLGGGAGDDRVDGGAGDDAMHGATGEDVLVGGEGDDLTDGGAGEDALLPVAVGRGQGIESLMSRQPGDARQPRGWAEDALIDVVDNVNALASTDALGNFLEDGNGDGVTVLGSVGAQACVTDEIFGEVCFSV